MARGVKHVARATTAAIAIAAASGCSSGSSPSTTIATIPTLTAPPTVSTTTLPLAQQKVLVQEFFQGNGKGKPLLVFLRGSQPLLNGTTLDRAECVRVLAQLQPKVGTGKLINQLLSEIPAEPMRKTMVQTFAYETSLFAFCNNTKAIPDGIIELAYNWSKRVKPSLAYYDVQF